MKDRNEDQRQAENEVLNRQPVEFANLDNQRQESFYDWQMNRLFEDIREDAKERAAS